MLKATPRAGRMTRSFPSSDTARNAHVVKSLLGAGRFTVNHTSLPEADHARLAMYEAQPLESVVFRPARSSTTMSGSLDQRETLSVWGDAHGTEPVRAVDPRAERKLDLPAPHHGDVGTARTPIGRDHVIEQLPWSATGNRHARERAVAGRREELQRGMGTSKKRDVPRGRDAQELRVAHVQRPGFRAAGTGHEQRVRVHAPGRAVDDGVAAWCESRGADGARAERQLHESGTRRRCGASKAAGGNCDPGGSGSRCDSQGHSTGHPPHAMASPGCAGKRNVRCRVVGAPLQRRRQVACALPALVGTLGQALLHDPIEIGWRVRPERRDQRRFVGQDRGHHAGPAVAAERLSPRRHFEEHDAQGEHVGACISPRGRRPARGPCRAACRGRCLPR